MMTTNLFVIANVKQLRTGGSFRILPLFLWTSWGVDVLNSAIFNRFYNRVGFGMILEDLRNFGEGGFEHPTPPPSVRHCFTRIFTPRNVLVRTDISKALPPPHSGWMNFVQVNANFTIHLNRTSKGRNKPTTLHDVKPQNTIHECI